MRTYDRVLTPNRFSHRRLQPLGRHPSTDDGPRTRVCRKPFNALSDRVQTQPSARHFGQGHHLRSTVFEEWTPIIVTCRKQWRAGPELSKLRRNVCSSGRDQTHYDDISEREMRAIWRSSSAAQQRLSSLEPRAAENGPPSCGDAPNRVVPRTAA